MGVPEGRCIKWTLTIQFKIVIMNRERKAMNSEVSINYNVTRHKRPYKFVSFVTLVAFMVTSLCGDILTEKGWSESIAPRVEMQNPVFDVSPEMISSEKLGGKKFILPAQLGRVTSSYFPAQEMSGSEDSTALFGEGDLRTIIYIQDAHCNYTCQRQISGIIEYLAEEYGIESVNLEGGEGAYDLSGCANIKEVSIREQTADYFLEEGIISGAEYFAVNNPGKVKLWGVENTGLYLENLSVYRESLDKRVPAEEGLNSAKNVLEQIKKKVYSKELLEIDAMHSGYEDGRLDIKEYLSFLVLQAGESKVNVEKLPNLYLLHSAMEKEVNIDFREANVERAKLVDILRKKLSRYELEKLVEKTALFRAGDVSSEEFHSYLFNKSRLVSVDLSNFSELLKYNIYASAYEAIDKSGVSGEMDALRGRIMEELYENSLQGELARVSKDLRLLSDMFGIKLTRDGYTYYLKNKDRFDSGEYLAFIKNEASSLGIKFNESFARKAMDSYRKKISGFFELSFKRDDVFVENAKIPLMNVSGANEGTKAAVLVTGGFHSENLFDLFRQNEIAYISIVPKFKVGKERKNPYFNLLSGKRFPLAEYVRSSASNLAIYSYLCGAGTQRVQGMSPGETRQMIAAAADAMSGVRTTSVDFGGRKVNFIASTQKPEGAEAVPGAEIKGKQLWAVWDNAGFGDEISFVAKMIGEMKDLTRRTFLTFLLVFMSFYAYADVNILPAMTSPVSVIGVEQSMASLPILMSQNLTQAEKILSEVEPFMDWLNKVPGIKDQNVKLETERRVYQVLSVLLELPDETLRVYRQANKVVAEMKESGVNLNVNVIDYVALLLTESDGGHILKGKEMTLSTGGKHRFPDGVPSSSAGAESHMQVMRPMVNRLNNIIEKGNEDPLFDGDTLQAARYQIFKGMGLTAEPIEWNKVIEGGEYADRVGLAIYLVSGFDINRWRVVVENNGYEILTEGQIKAKYPDVDLNAVPTLGSYAAALIGVNEGDIIAAAYNYGVGGVKASLKQVLEGEIFFEALPRETARQTAMSFVNSSIQRKLFASKILQIREEGDSFDISFAEAEKEEEKVPVPEEVKVETNKVSEVTSEKEFEEEPLPEVELKPESQPDSTPSWTFLLRSGGVLMSFLILCFASAGIVLTRLKREKEQAVKRTEGPASNFISRDSLTTFQAAYIESLETSLDEQAINSLIDENGSLENIARIAEKFFNGEKEGFMALILRVRDQNVRLEFALLSAFSLVSAKMADTERMNTAGRLKDEPPPDVFASPVPKHAAPVKQSSSVEGEPMFEFSGKMSSVEFVCLAGEEIGEKGLGSDLMRDKMIRAMEASQRGFYKDLFGGEKFYSFVIGDNPTEETGKTMVKEAVLSPFSKLRGSLRRWAGIQEFGNMTMGDAMGIAEAKELISKIIGFAGEMERGNIEPQNRINCSISENIWNLLDEQDREVLRDNTMLSKIKDYKEEAGIKVIYPLPYGRLHNMAIARLNISHLMETSAVDVEDDSFQQVVMSYAHALALVSNNDNVALIFKDLMGSPAMLSDPKEFFINAIFRIYLPPIAKINLQMVLQGFLAEAEVLRSL